MDTILAILIGIVIGLIPSFIIYSLTNKREEEVKRREASIAITELLSKWIESKYLDRNDNQYYWELQSMYWKTILRADKRLLDILLPRLANKESAEDTDEIIVQCRKILLGLKETDIKATELNNWPPKKSL